MTDIQFYQSAYEFLLDTSGVKKKDLIAHFEIQAESKKPDDMKIIFRQLCDSAQNKQMSTKVIGKAIQGIDNLRIVLYNFDPALIAEDYLVTDWEKLLRDIIIKLKPGGKVRKTPKSEWPKYCVTVLEGAYFLKSFVNCADFYSWTNKFCEDERSKYALPLLIATEINGFGFPLACDFLKEIGYTTYGKPDVHINQVLEELNIVKKAPSIRKNYLSAKALDRIALANNISPFQVDKVLWLIATGDFHISGTRVARQKKNFITYMQKKFPETVVPVKI